MRDYCVAAIPVVLMSVLIILLSPGCAAVVNRPCPYVTEFPVDVQRAAAAELRTGTVPALERVMEGVTRDRAANRAICAG